MKAVHGTKNGFEALQRPGSRRLPRHNGNINETVGSARLEHLSPSLSTEIGPHSEDSELHVQSAESKYRFATCPYNAYSA